MFADARAPVREEELESAPPASHRGLFATSAYTRHRRRLDAARENLADSLHDGARDLRRAARRAQWKAEDVASEARGRIRRSPLGTVGVAFVSGLMAALVTAAGIGLALRQHSRR